MSRLPGRSTVINQQYGPPGGGGYDYRRSQGDNRRGNNKRPRDSHRVAPPPPAPVRDPNEGVERLVDLITNAIPLAIDGSRFDKLHVYSIKYSGPQPMSMKMSGLKSMLLSRKELMSKLPERGVFFDYRDEEGAKAYVAQMRLQEPSVAEQMAELAEDTEVLVRKRGEEEVWRIHFQEEHGSPLSAPSDNPSLFLNFANHIMKDIICRIAGYTLLNHDRCMVKMDSRNSMPLQSLDGELYPGFIKNLFFTVTGSLYWTFKPQNTLRLNTDMWEFLESEHGTIPTSEEGLEDISRQLARKRITVVSSYNPSNVYRVVGLAGKKPTDMMESWKKTANGDIVKKSMSHIDYLRERYPDDPKLNSYPNLENSLMVAVAMTGKTRKGPRTSRVVHIPAPLLNLVSVRTQDLDPQAQSEIIRVSQLKPYDAHNRIRGVVSEMGNPQILKAFEEYGFTLQPRLVEIQGLNNVGKIVNVEVPGHSDRLVRLALDEQCSFMRDFIRSDHLHPPLIRHWMVVYPEESAEKRPPNALFSMVTELIQLAMQKGWTWYNAPNSDRELEDHLIPLPPDITPTVRRLLAQIKQGTHARPDIIIGFIPRKEEFNYAIVKRFAYRIGSPSQVITGELYKRLRSKAFWKVLSGMCGKLNSNAQSFPHPWQLREPPLREFSQYRGDVTCLSIATYVQSQHSSGYGGSLGWGITATATDDCTGIVQDFGVTQSGDRSILPRLDLLVGQLLHRLHYQYQRTFRNILVYRRGVSEGQISRIVQVELPALRKALRNIVGGQVYNPESRILSLTWPPMLKEKGRYGVRVPCVNVEDGSPATHSAEVNLEVLVDEDGKKLFTLRVEIPPELRVDETKSASIQRAQSTAFERMPDRARITLVVTNRSNMASLLTFNKGGSMMTPGGTVVSKHFNCVPQSLGEFYIIPGSGSMGFSAPVHYIIAHNDMAASTQLLSDITLKLSFLYYNHQGSNKVPHLLRIAETAAEQALTVYEGIDDCVREDLKETCGFVDPAEVGRLKNSAIFL